MNMQSLARSLARHSFSQDFPRNVIDFMVGCTRNVRFATGEYLFREGTAADRLYLLRRGQVDLESQIPGKGPVALERLSAGEWIGASTVFGPYEWHVDARAVAPVWCFAVDGACLRDKMLVDHEFGYVVVRRMLAGVHQRLARVRLQQLDVYRQELS